MSWDDEINEILLKRKLALEQGGLENIERQHAKGLLTIRERVSVMLDEGSFREIGPTSGGVERNEDGSLKSFSPANFILGFGKIKGKRCIIGGEDFTVRGGSPNEAGLRKSIYTEDLALQHLIPLIRLHQGGGGSVTGSGATSKVIGSPVFNAPRFRSVARTMWSIPVATAALGAVAGLPAARLVASHFSVMTKENSQVLVAGPKVVERALKENITKEAMGGAHIHTRNGVVDNIAENEHDAFEQIEKFISYMPQNAWCAPTQENCDDPASRKADVLSQIVPADRRKIYDMRKIISLVVDKDSVFEVTKNFGRVK
jgi:acetyl-CoA carboxylase carboxyltransferase component